MSATTATAELQILISIVQDSKDALKAILSDVKNLTSAFQSVNDTEVDKAVEGIKGLSDASEKVETEFKHLGKEGEDSTKKTREGFVKTREEAEKLDEGVKKVFEALKFLAGGFLAYEGVEFVKDLADTAARAEVLQTVLHVVGNNAGFMSEELDKADKTVQRLGITASASRQSLTQLLQGGFDLETGPKLARLAQNAAVILGVNSSEAFQRLVTATQLMNTQMLRNLGIVIDSEHAMERYAQSINKTVSQLTIHERQVAFMNETILRGSVINDTYIESMGNVGKQLTSLEREFETTKEALGVSLLPAYKAVVEELTSFLHYLQDTTEAENAAGDGGKRLGEVVREIAHDIREVAEFIIDHREGLIKLGEAYLFVRYLALPFISLLQYIASEGGVEVALSGIANAVLRVVGVVGLGVTTIGTLGLALVGLVLFTTRGRQAFLSLVDAITAVIKTLTGIGSVVGATLVAGIKSFYDYVVSGFDPNSVRAPWKEWSDIIKHEIDGVISWWKSAKEHFSETINPTVVKPNQTGPSAEELRDDLIKEKTAKLAQAEDLMDVSKQHLEDAQKDKTLSEIALDKFRSDFEQAKKNADTARDEWEKTLDKERVDATRREAEAAAVATKKAAFELQRDLDALSQERQNTTAGKFEFNTETGEETSSNFQKIMQAFSTELDFFKKGTKEAHVSINELLRDLQLGSTAAQFTGNVRDMAKAVEDFRATGKLTAEQLRLAQAYVLQASISVQRFQSTQLQEVFSRNKASFDATTQLVDESLKQELTSLKSIHQLEEVEDRSAYSRGLQTLDEYYANRRKRIQAESELELRQAKKDLERAQLEPVHTVEESLAKQVKVAQAKDLVLQLQGGKEAYKQALDELNKAEDQQEAAQTARQKRIAARRVSAAEKTVKALEPTKDKPSQEEIQIQTLDTQQEDERKRLAEQVIDLQNQTAAAFGGEKEQIDIIDEKYRRLAERLGDVKDAAFAIFDARKLDLFKAKIDALTKALENQVTAEQAVLDLRKTTVESRTANFDITTTEKMREENAIIRDQVELYNREIEAKARILQLLVAQRDEQAASFRKQLEDSQLYSSDEVSQLVNERFSGITKQIVELGGDIHGLDGKTRELLASIDTYGKQLAKTFQDSLATAISNTLKNVREAKNAIIGLSEALRDKIVTTIGQHLAEKITTSIINGTKDAEGHSVFDKVFTFLGFKDQDKLGATKSKRMYVSAIIETQESTRLLNGIPTSINPANIGGSFGDYFSLITNTTKFIKEMSAAAQAEKAAASAASITNFAGFFAEGGPIKGPGNGTSDSIPAINKDTGDMLKVSNGEYIVPEKQTKKFYPLLEAIRQGKVESLSALTSLAKIATFSSDKKVAKTTSHEGMKENLTKMAKFAMGGVINSVQSIAGMPYPVPVFADGGTVDDDRSHQFRVSLAPPPMIPVQYERERAGVTPVIRDGGVSQVQPAAKVENKLVVSDEHMNKTLANWFEGYLATELSKR